MQKWEYCEVVETTLPIRVCFYSTSGSHENQVVKDAKQVIAQLGQEGWELVSIFMTGSPPIMHYHFKRPIE